MAGAFLETQRLAEEAVRYQRNPTGVVVSGTDPRVTWTLPEIIAAAEARLQVLGTQLGRLSQVGTAMTATLCRTPSNRAASRAWRIGWRWGDRKSVV